MVEVYSKKNEFETVGEWEFWAANEFLGKEALRKRFEDDLGIVDELGKCLGRFIGLSGTKVVFHLAKMIQTLGDTGLPSPLLNARRDLHSVLWSNWADEKITLGGEQVNRSTVFSMTREIPEAACRARLLNPKCGIAQEESLRLVEFFFYFYF